MPESVPSFALGRGGRAGSEGANKPVYVDLTPALVGNYGSGPRLQYCKADIALQVADRTRRQVEHHEPLIRNQLIMLFAQQTDQSLGTVEARKACARRR